MPAPRDDLRDEPLDTQLANTLEQLHALARVAADAHSLAYDRAGARWPEPLSKPDQQRADHNRGAHPDLRGDSDPHRLPVAWRRDGSITTAASPPWALRYQQAAQALVHADRILADLIHDPHRPWPALVTAHIDAGQAPRPDFFARIAQHCAAALTVIEDTLDELDQAARDTLADALKRIDHAWQRVPDMTPRRDPRACRNPAKRQHCKGFPISHKKKQLCDSCHQAERDARRKAAREAAREAEREATRP